MVYAGRHPHTRFLIDGSIEAHLEFLRAGIPKQPRSRFRVRARRSWDIYCEIINRIEGGKIRPIRKYYDRQRRIDPVRTKIRTSDVARLAVERREKPKFLSPKATKLGRPPEYNWDSVKERLKEYAAQSGPVQSLNELLQKCADFAYELHPEKRTPSDKTIRDAIKAHRLDDAAGFDPGK